MEYGPIQHMLDCGVDCGASTEPRGLEQLSSKRRELAAAILGGGRERRREQSRKCVLALAAGREGSLDRRGSGLSAWRRRWRCECVLPVHLERLVSGIPIGALDAAVELGALGGEPRIVARRELSGRHAAICCGRGARAGGGGSACVSTRGGARLEVHAGDAVAMLVSADTIWLGEHHEAANDREIQAGIIAAVAVAKATRMSQQQQRPCVGVGLEAVRAEFQPALDAFVAGELGENLEGLRKAAKWDDHWPFPISSYASVLDMCRELALPLVALGASSDELRAVERDGLAALDETGWRHLSLPEGAATLASFSSTSAFHRYSIDVLVPSLRPANDAPTSSFANHFCSRILWDESMAARAADWVETRRDLDPTLVVLAGAEHVTFGCGAPARCARRLGAAGNRFAARSVLLNPLPDDFVQNDRLTLGLQFAKDDDEPDAAFDMGQVRSRDATNLQLSDLVWFSPWTADCA